MFPVREYLAGLDPEARALVLAAMKEAQLAGRSATRQIKGEIREHAGDPLEGFIYRGTT